MAENEKLTSSIKKIVLTDATFADTPEKERIIEPSFVNFFFGKNGSGKTTIGRQIRDDRSLEYDPLMPRQNYDVLVYNQDFIEENFRTYDGFKGVFTISKKGVDDSHEIEVKEAQKKEYQRLANEAKEQLDKNQAELAEAYKTFSSDCFRNVKEIRETYKDQLKGFLKPDPFAQKVLNTSSIIEYDEKKLAELYKSAFDSSLEAYLYFDTFPEHALDIGVVPACPLLEEPIVSRSDTEFSRFVKALNATDWVRAGHEAFPHPQDGLCPYCQQKLPADFEEKIAACFDTQYLNDIEAVKAFRDTYRGYMLNLYHIFSGNLDKKTLPELDLEHYKAQLGVFSEKVKNNITLIDQKIQKPASVVTLEDITPDMLDMNYITMKINEKIDENNRAFAERKNSIERFPQVLWGMIAHRLQGEIESYRSKLQKLEEEHTQLVGKKKLNEELIYTFDKKISELGKTNMTILKAIEDINLLLDESGFEGFHIEKSDRAKNAYRVVRQNKDRTTAVKLSEGERNFIAFLYFYQTVKGSLDDSGIVKDKIVVIDDPISSMDSNVMFLVSALVRELIEICNNNTEYRHIQVKGNYIKQIFILTHNAYFHKVITCNQIDRFKSVNFYMVDKMNNISTVTHCIDYSKESAGDLVNVNPVKNSYAALWAEYKALDSSLPLMNVMHRILDYYFLDICGYDGIDIRQEILVKHKDDFIETSENGTEDRTKFQTASALLAYIAAGIGSDDVHYVRIDQPTEKMKDVFKMIFERLGQGKHYELMMRKSR